jgi:hypothetical protein
LIHQDKWCMLPECHPDHRQSKSDERGEFAVADLDPGPWLVAATAPSSLNPPTPQSDERLGWAQTFYPGVTVPGLAQAVNPRRRGRGLSRRHRPGGVRRARLLKRHSSTIGGPGQGNSLLGEASHIIVATKVSGNRPLKLVLRRPRRVVDHHNFQRRFSVFQLEPELLQQCRLEQISIARL